ncbi:hypothetical protein SSX86_030364 [Deinandra increscens subsp. villosa]|uniref:Uncharacterized protein n=1 Tax=Deinandra increscens subsp. villosa TaxID=3103831 RepID=A0AAP0C5W8_9ASTR
MVRPAAKTSIRESWFSSCWYSGAGVYLGSTDVKKASTGSTGLEGPPWSKLTFFRGPFLIGLEGLGAYGVAVATNPVVSGLTGVLVFRGFSSELDDRVLERR